MSLGKLISFCASPYFVWTPVVQKDDFDTGISGPSKLGCGDCFALGVSAQCSAAALDALETCSILIPMRRFSGSLKVSRDLAGKHSVGREIPYSIYTSPPSPLPLPKSDSQWALRTPEQFLRPLE